MKIAIDGPAGAGKSTVARMVANKMGFVYIDTGAMYRALTWKALQQGIDLHHSQALKDLAQATDISFTKAADTQRVICDGEDVSEAIRSPRINSTVSTVAADPMVREIMVEKQQILARVSCVVMDGRDIGETVLPDADYKFFITASLEERAHRRLLELEAQGFTTGLEELRKDIANRDQMDCERPVGALKILSDAIVIDTSFLSIDESLRKILDIIGEI